MRIITGDECGLLKEVIPERCRPPAASDGADNSSSAYAAVHSGRARPSATSVQQAAASYAHHHHQTANDGGGPHGASAWQRAVTRLEPGPEAQGRERGVVALAFLPNDGDDGDDAAAEEGGGAPPFRFAALRANGVVEAWEATRSAAGCDKKEANVTAAAYRRVGGLAKGVLPENDDAENNDGENDDADHKQRGWHARQPMRPIGMASNYSPKNNSRGDRPILATCDSVGTLSLLRADDLSRGVVAAYRAFDVDLSASSLPAPSSSKNDAGHVGTLTYARGRFANAHMATAMAVGPGGRIAVGGRERGARVLEAETGQLLWKAKNLPPDPQTLLQQPMWTTAMQFLQTPTAAIHNGTNDAGHLLATGTAYKQVQIYDIRASASARRPVLYTPEGLLDHRTTALCQLPDGHTLAVGDAAGDCLLLDLRKLHSGKQFTSRRQHAAEEMGVGRLAGPGGSIRQLSVHPTLPYLACVGLDRKLWTWDVRRKTMTDCVYLKQRLNCLLVCDDEGWGDDDDADDERRNEYEMDAEAGSGRTLEEDAVEDYVDSDDDDGGEGGGNGNVIDARGRNAERKEGGAGSEETASDSEGGGGGEEEDGASESEASDDGSTSGSGEDEAAPPAANSKKRRTH